MFTPRLLVPLMAFLCAFQSSISQDVTLKANRLELKDARLDVSFTAYSVYELELNSIHEVSEAAEEFSLLLEFDDRESWLLHLVAHDLRAPMSREILITDAGNIVLPRRSNITYRGMIDVARGGEVRMTISQHLFMGYVTIGKTEYFIEPLNGILQGTSSDQYIVYRVQDVRQRTDLLCGATQLQQYAPTEESIEGMRSQQRDHECLEVELAIASDSTMLDRYGTAQAVNDRIITITNLMEPLYAVFDLNYIITDMFVAANDPWSALVAPTTWSDEAFDILDDFLTWAPGNMNTHDIGQFWTARNIQGCGGSGFGLVGCAEVIGGVCTASSYNVCEDYTNNFTTLRVLSAHEIGHLWGGTHGASDPTATPGNPTTIMHPTITTSATTFSTGNITNINNHIHSRDCLAACGTQCDIEITGIIVSDETCPGDSDGAITVTATTSEGTITYSINGPVMLENNTGVFTNLPPGMYDILVTDDDFFETCTDDSTAVVAAGVDNAPPVINCPTDIIVTLDPGECRTTVFWPTPSFTDNCGATIAQTGGPPSGSVFEQETTTVIEYTATDESNNTSVCTFSVIVNPYPFPLSAVHCNNSVNVSVDAECSFLVTADMLLEGGPYMCYEDYLVFIEGVVGNVNYTEVSLALGSYTATVTNPESGISCWGVLNIEDGIPPQITCIDVTVFCGESLEPVPPVPGGAPDLPYAPITSDNCDDQVSLTYADVETGDLCEGNLMILRTWTANDDSPKSPPATCVQTININPLSIDGLVCPPNLELSCNEADQYLLHPYYTGWPTVNGVTVPEGGLCNIFVGYWDTELADCGGGKKIVRRWTVLDWCTQESTECFQVIKIIDDEGPWLDCPSDITAGTDPWFCHTDVDVWIEAVDHCDSYPLTYAISVNGGTAIHLGGVSHYEIKDLPEGHHYVTWIVTDACDNSSTCTTDVWVKDDIHPVAICDEHTILALTIDDPLDEGLTKLHAESLDDGSYDNCSDVTFLARRMPPPVPAPFEPSCIDFDWISNSEPYQEYPFNDGGPPEAIDLGYTFQPWVPFACCDAGKTVLVELLVTDEAGNTNTCMVEVEVQDKLKPVVECPPDITVGCEFWFDAHETNGFQPADGLENVFGRVLDAYEYDEEDRAPVIINDPSPGSPYYLQDHLWGYDGWADDNCDVTITVDTDIDDDCSGESLPGNAPDNAVRLIRRTFRAVDGSGNRETCTQRIWVVDFDPFEISDEVCGLWPGGDDVRWPCDITITDCPQGELTPENLSEFAPNNEPLFRDDNCSLIGVTYEDQIFYFVEDACYKIVRKWTIIDWCQFEEDGNGGHYGYWTWVQVIKVHDSEAPLFEECPVGPLVYCVDAPNVELPSTNQVFLGEGNPGSSSCSAHMWESLTVFETCSDHVIYDVKLYGRYDNPDLFDQIVAKTTVDLDENGIAILSWDTRNNSLPASHPIRRNGLEYNDRHCSNWPQSGGVKDYYRVLWTVEDGCGNINTCEYLIRLEDCKEPSPVCVSLSSVVMPNSGSVTIWAVDFDASSFDDCTPHDDLLFSFSGTTYQPSREFDCDDIAANESPSFLVEIWVADEGNDQNCNGFIQPIGIEWSERNKDFCTTFIVIDDNDNTCGDSLAGGVIETEEFEAVEKVNVKLTDMSGQVMHSFTTDKNGLYHFINPLFDYYIEPDRNDNHKNGVSTLDLVAIQKHLLGIKQLESPYKMIAADANNSESVSALDLVEIRKLILGLYTEFPKNTSWRFVDGAFEFEDPTHPWPFDEVILSHSGMTMHEDFVGVKVGDVNGTVAANANQITTRGARDVLKLQVEDREVKYGDIIEIPVSARNFNNILGFQLTMETEGLEYSGVTSGALTMPAEFIAKHKGAITMSWLDLDAIDLGAFAEPTSVNVNPEQALFTLHFTATQNGRLSDLLKITSAITEAEAYADLEASNGPSSVNKEPELLDIALTFGKTSSPAGPDFSLYQNEPNPFTEQTVIGFDLPDAMEVTLKVYDMQGRIVHTIEGDYNSGFNTVVLRKRELGGTGMYHYRLTAGDFTASKKFILVSQ